MGIIDIDDRGRNDPKGHHSRAMGPGAGIGGRGLGFRHSLRTTAAREFTANAAGWRRLEKFIAGNIAGTVKISRGAVNGPS
jgi:hypothetical protein